MKWLIWGCGNMASAFSRGLKQENYQADEFLCYNPTPQKALELARILDGKIYQQETVDVIVLGFKPQHLSQAATELTRKLQIMNRKPWVISLLAATTLAQLESFFPDVPIIRVMPNMAVGHNQGVVLWSGQAEASVLSALRPRLEGLGFAPFVTETDLDVLTLHAGCSPAFLYYWMEQAMDFAQVHGVDPELAKEILLRSWQSALSYMEGTPGEMIKRIASKGGVTQATLDYWENHHPNYVSMGFREGLKRVQELKHRS